jgi:hypothetical protein
MTDPLLLDQFLPAWDHEISMSQLFRAPPADPGNRGDLRCLRRAGVRQAGGEHRGHPVRRRGVRADAGEPGGDDRRGQPATVPALLASGGAVHPADAPDGDARPGAVVASRRLPQAGAMTAEKAARLRRLHRLNSPPRRSDYRGHRPPRRAGRLSSRTLNGNLADARPCPHRSVPYTRPGEDSLRCAPSGTPSPPHQPVQNVRIRTGTQIDKTERRADQIGGYRATALTQRSSRCATSLPEGERAERRFCVARNGARSIVRRAHSTQLWTLHIRGTGKRSSAILVSARKSRSVTRS